MPWRINEVLTAEMIIRDIKKYCNVFTWYIKSLVLQNA